MSIYRDKPTGRWRFEFDHYIEGRRVRQRELLPAAYTRAQAEAFDRKESAALWSLARGVTKPRYTIDQAVACYLRERAPELKHGLVVERELALVQPWCANRSIEELPAVAAEYSVDQRDALAPATIKNRIAYLRAACRWAWKRHGWADADPGARVVMPTVRNARDTVVDRAGMLAIAKACSDRGTRALIRILYYTGMRVSEVYAARLAGACLVLEDSKNGSPRVVPVHPRIAVALRVPMTDRTKIDHYWRKARAAAGFHGVRLHDLRHSTASALVSAGVDLPSIGALLGHKSAASTKRYSHWATDRMAEVVGKIGRRRA